MRSGLISRLRNRLVRYLSGHPARASSFLIRTLVKVALFVMAVPRVVRVEIWRRNNADIPDIKTALRISMWLWNRSWIPFKQPLSTYFDIGWILSKESCCRLLAANFLSKDPLQRTCDLAQYRLSAIRSAFEAGDELKLLTADKEVLSITQEIFSSAEKWVTSHDASISCQATTAPLSEPTPKRAHGGFDNDGTAAALLDFDDICKSLGQDFFIISGTLLGAVRDSAFLPHDHDIDLGIFDTQLLDSFVPALQESSSFTIRRAPHILLREDNSISVKYRLMEVPAIYQVVHRSGTLIDLFVHFSDDDVIWHGDRMHRWDNLKFDLRDYEFLGRRFKGPENFDLYLTENYGSDWRVPKIEFDSMIDTPNLRFAGSANSLVFWAWMVAHAVRKKDTTRVQHYLQKLAEFGVYQNDGAAQKAAP